MGLVTGVRGAGQGHLAAASALGSGEQGRDQGSLAVLRLGTSRAHLHNSPAREARAWPLLSDTRDPCAPEEAPATATPAEPRGKDRPNKHTSPVTRPAGAVSSATAFGAGVSGPQLPLPCRDQAP